MSNENGNAYVSSIIFRYGDTDNVKHDVKTLNDIMSRQGDKLIIDCIAEQTGITAIKFKLNTEEKTRLINSLVNELKQALLERL